MAESSRESEPVYHRRLDRSPETQEFKSLPPADKNLVSQLRHATKNTRVKLDELRDGMEDKEREALREAALRKAAEERLDQLVDMYGDPAVNEELRDRLPRAAKTDPRVTWQQELDDMQQTDGARVRDSSPEGKGGRHSGNKDSSRRSHSPPPGGRGPFDDHPGYPHHPPPPFGAYYPNQQQPGYYPHQIYPMASPQMVYMMPPQGVTAAAHIPAPGAPSISPPAPTTTPANQNQAASGSSNQNESTQAVAKDIVVQRENSRQIALLLAELDAARDLNKKLQQRLAGTQQELDSLKISQKTREVAIEADSSSKAAALVEEIYRAQKDREEAIMGRLRIANEERDEALLKLRNRDTSPNQYDCEGDEDSDLNVKDVLAQLESLDSNSAVDQQGRHLVDAINRRKQRLKQNMTEEMKAVLEERDNAVAKCNKLEADVMKLTRQVRGKTPEKQQNATLQAKLLATQQERDMALTRLSKMEEELQTLRVYYSLHKSLSQEANLRDQFHNTLENYEGQIKHRDTIMDQAHKDNNQLVSQLKTAVAKNSQMEAQLSKAQNAQRHLQEHNAKLEKIVSLLRERVKEVAPPITD